MPRLRRQPLFPAWLAGWTWDVLDLGQVPVHPHDVLTGDGMAMLRGHFAIYRPLVSSTALGAAAAVFDTVTTNLADRRADGRIRDSRLVSRGHARLVTALLGAAAASRLAALGNDRAELFGCDEGARRRYRAPRRGRPRGVVGSGGLSVLVPDREDRPRPRRTALRRRHPRHVLPHRGHTPHPARPDGARALNRAWHGRDAHGHRPVTPTRAGRLSPAGGPARTTRSGPCSPRAAPRRSGRPAAA
jgi:hypothetical protein